MFFDHCTIVLMDGILMDHASYTAGGIDIGMTTDHRSGIQNRIAAYFNVIAQHCSNFLDPCLDLLFTILNDYESLIGLDVRSDGTCSHVAEIT